ncbi:MAG TPA: alpha-L-fucosidase [Candidatus Paceibacterota bacterium]|nr:alpha-L-fucosidase [Candidatus Paceibacterota bacterium]
MKNPLHGIAAAAVLASSLGLTHAAEVSPAPSLPRPYAEHLRWWAEARFGMFIHWGPVSLKGAEISWSRANTNPKCPNRGPMPAEVYDNLYKEFNPTNFNAAEWVDIARRGGAKYLVLTAKHCDGFLLWHSRASDYNIAATPFKRDVCAELASAARREGMRIGWYFSPMDWRDPDFRTERNPAFLARMQSEVRELLSGYGRIDLLWFDWDGREPVYDQAATYRLVRSLQPAIVINNRLDLGPGGSNRQMLAPDADYYTPEQEVGAYDDQRPWESCMTLSSRNQWAWGGPSDGVKSLDECLAMLMGCAGGDGNLLLNVGPMPDGRIPPDQAGRLKEIGAWLSEFGESIYGTRGGPFKPGDYGVSTRKENFIYLHIREWDGGKVRLPRIPAGILRASVLPRGEAKVRQTADGIEVLVAEADRHPLDTIVKLELDGPACSLPAVAVPGGVPLTLGAKAAASNIYKNEPNYGPGKAVDGSDTTRWATDSGVKSAWLEVDLGKPVTFNSAVIKQAYPELGRIRRFAIEYFAEGKWTPCYEGEKPGARLRARFAPVTAQRVRLNITEATDGPTLTEFSLFGPER